MPHPPEHITNPRPTPIPAAQLAHTHTIKRTRWLLAQAWLRLRAGRKLESERGIIYPEVGLTARDVERLTDKLAQLTASNHTPNTTHTQPKNPLARQKSS